MSMDLLEHVEVSEAFSDTEWKPRDAQTRRAFDKSAKAPTSLSTRGWRIPLPQGVVKFADEPPARLKATIQQIANFCNLKLNWDSYGAKPVDPNNAVTAILILLNAVDDSTPLPTVVPLSQGGIQLEWHCNGADLEIVIASPSRIRASFEDLNSGDCIDTTLVGDLRPVQGFLQRLSRVN